MAKVYLLGGLVVFSPERNVLHAKADETKRLALSNPASRCLLLLIQRQGQVIERDYFFQHVWINNGAQVTNNTFYQNISLLRRAFKEFGLNEELIVTVPKVGIRLEANLDVVDQEAEETLPEAPAPERVVPVKAVIPPRAASRWRTLYWLLAGVACCCLAAAVAWQTQFDPRLSQYEPLVVSKGCHWYANQDVLNYDKHQKFIQASTLDCKEYPWIYLTLYPNFPRISALTCRQQYSRWRDNECATHYYFPEPRNVGA